MKLEIGLNAISSYRRMDYTIWYALAEFVDNSTQSYFDNRAALDEAFDDDENLEVRIAYDRDDDFMRISDNAMGMNEEELKRALRVAVPPEEPYGRCRYGMGMKTAACWIGNTWTIRTKKLGETSELTVTVDVEKVAGGNANLETKKSGGHDKDLHYTILEIRDLNRPFRGRTIGKIKQYLGSMYRQDLSDGILTLSYDGEDLVWHGFDDKLRVNKAGERIRKEFSFKVDEKPVRGWAGVLHKGSRKDVGFSILHSNRVVKGWPDSWRPERIFGNNTNNLLNQRLLGEIHLDAFEVTHTKDGIQWYGGEQEAVEKKLEEAITDLIATARTPWKDLDDDNGPSDGEVEIALTELEGELKSPQMVDEIELTDIPDEEALKSANEVISDPKKASGTPDIEATIGRLTVWVFLAGDLSVNDPYVISEPGDDDKVIVIINMKHPHLKQLQGESGLLNYFRHCVYDAIAEWKAKKTTGTIGPHTVKAFKDSLLRVSFQMQEAVPIDPGNS